MEGTSGDGQYHLPHITSLSIGIRKCQSWMMKQLLEVMFQGCDLRELQTLTMDVIDIYIQPEDYYDRIINFLLQQGYHIKSICLQSLKAKVPSLLAAICKYCTSLEHWELKQMIIQDSSLFTCLSLPNTLHSLSLNCVPVNNANMGMICRSSLTKLSLIGLFTQSMEAYYLIGHSFSQTSIFGNCILFLSAFPFLSVK